MSGRRHDLRYRPSLSQDVDDQRAVVPPQSISRHSSQRSLLVSSGTSRSRCVLPSALHLQQGNTVTCRFHVHVEQYERASIPSSSAIDPYRRRSFQVSCYQFASPLGGDVSVIGLVFGQCERARVCCDSHYAVVWCNTCGQIQPCNGLGKAR